MSLAARLRNRTGRLLLLLAAAMLPWWPARAQFTRFQGYAEEQGLGNLVITALAQDRDGYLLAGTQGGLYRYDGVGFASDFPGLPRDAIAQIAIDRLGRIWIMTKDSGLFLGDGTAFHAVAIGRPWVSGWNWRHLVVLDDAVVLAVGNVLLRAPLRPDGPGSFEPLLDRAAANALPALGDIRFVVPDGGGGVLIGCGRALCRTAGGRLDVLGPEAGLPADEWLTAVRGPDGTLWARSLRRLAWRRPGQASFTVVSVPGTHEYNFHDSAVGRDLLFEGAGVLTEGDAGLLVWTGSAWQSLAPHAGGLPAAPVIALLRDHEGSLWVGSEGYGLFRDQQRGIWEHWTTEDGLPSDQVWGVSRQSDRRLWVVTNHGSVPLDGTTKRIPGGAYTLATSRAGRLWLFPSDGPAVRIEPDGRTATSFGLLEQPGALVDEAIVDQGDALWLATDQDVFRVPDADGATPPTRLLPVLHAPSCLLPTDPAGRLYAICRGSVFRFDGRNGFERLAMPGSFAGSPLDAAFMADGDLWVTTVAVGLQRFRLADGTLSRRDGALPAALAGLNIVSLHRDRRGRVWLGSDHGAYLFDGRTWRHFDNSDGPISNDLNQAALYEDADGSMWFGTSHGLSHLLDPDHLSDPPPLHPLITAVTLGERSFPPGGSLRLDWSREPLTVRAVDLDYARGRGIAFRYRLAGVDSRWNETTAHEMRYAGLPAGRLRFELAAVDTLHGTVSAPIGFDITIRPPWWERWWFYAACALTAAVASFVTWRVRTRLLLRQRRQLEMLVATRTAEIGEARDLLERQAEDLKRLALSDALTGLANRHAIMAELAASIAASREPGAAPLAVLICDIDHFKAINDRFGHLVGDAVLEAFAGRLGGAIVFPEAVGRFGGEEFLAILRSEPATIPLRLSALRAVLGGAPIRIAGEDRSVTCSGGLAFLRDGDTPFTLLARADAALYRAKANGRDRIEEEGDEGAAELPERSGDGGDLLRRDLRAALNRDEFTLVYQPIVDVGRNRTTAYEALLRWTSPHRGEVPPAEFIPFAERSGLMTEIDRWVLRRACRDAAGWQEEARLSVNLSASHFHRSDLVQDIAAVLNETGLPGRRLELEVTETAMIADVEAAAIVLARLRALGISIALDDFGTGYSSLSFLRTLPFDRVKIDRSFVRDLGDRPEASAIIGGVIHLCTGMGTAVTAEGVETDEQLALLQELGCREMQGYRFGRPGPVVALRQVLEQV